MEILHYSSPSSKGLDQLASFWYVGVDCDAGRAGAATISVFCVEVVRGPLARSLGPVGVAAVSVALGRGAAISYACFAGIAIIVLGSAMLPLDQWTGLRFERFRSRAFGGAVLTAIANKVGSIDLAGETVWRPNNSIRALDRLPVTFRAP